MTHKATDSATDLDLETALTLIIDAVREEQGDELLAAEEAIRTCLESRTLHDHVTWCMGHDQQQLRDAYLLFFEYMPDEIYAAVRHFDLDTWSE